MTAASPVATPLPAPASQLVGRERELAAVTELVLHSDSRLVTLVGPGGIGKTRLARAVAATFAADRAVFVDLSPLTEPELVVPTIAHALGLSDTSRSALELALINQHWLLVLDNFEQVVEAARDVEQLLQASAGLRILVTSRAPLHLSGERSYFVPPLATPDAVDLFVRRAQATRPGFQLTADNETAIAEICTRLDGIPLALELAAARVRVLSAQQIAHRLEERFELLTAGAADAPARHRTLRAALDWSFLMLGAPERALLRRMAVFAGGASLDALEAVVVDDMLDRRDLLDVLTNLVDHSLVGVHEQAGEARYRLLETVRQYGLERLREAGEDRNMRERTAAWCLELAERAEPELMGSRPRTWLDLLERELDNIRGALSWWHECGAADNALRLAGALWKFCEVHGHIGEGRAWLAAALALDGQASVDQLVRSKALHGAGILAGVGGDCEQAREIHEANAALRRQLGDTRGVAMSLLHLADVLRSQGQTERAIDLANECLALFRTLDDRRMCATTLNNLGMALVDRRAFAAARAALEEALSVFRALDCPRQIGCVLDNLGDLARQEGSFARAEAHLIESLQIFQTLNAAWDAAFGLQSLALVAVAQGEAERAARLFGAAEAHRGAAGAALEPADRPEHDRSVATLRVRLGPDELAACWTAGRSLSLEGALALARDTSSRQKQRHEPTRIAFAQTVALEGSPLTDREREVAALVAHGLTNRQIADALVITKQTADKHVGNILGKLGVASRSQVAVWVVQHGIRPLAQAPAA